MTIRVLAPDVAAKIAAGEVIERPASIVKELLENALDADARRITIEIEGGGTTLIRVSDDGRGLAPSEIPVAFLRHATSKLRRPEDLASVATLGFRGEALPSIAAAADIDFASRPEGAASGGRLRLAGGEILDESAYGGAPGTVVTVRDLFEQQPARRKFLRSASSEAGQIASVVSNYAIAYPEVAFLLQANGRRSLVTPGSGDRREAVARVYGAETASALLEIDSEGSSAAACVLTGLLSPPQLTRSSRSYIVCYVNRRLVQPRRLAYVAESAYESLLPSGRHPIAILDLRLPTAEVDVNVHPTKSEVRFLRDREVQSAVYHSVRQRLARVEAPTTFSMAPGRAGWAQTAPAGEAPAPPMPLWRAITDIQGHDRVPEPPASRLPTDSTRPPLPILRVVGQTGSLYIVAEGPDGMYLLDQHAAHERVLYERILAERAAHQITNVQGLLSPSAVELSAVQDAILSEHLADLSAAGFAIEPFGAQAYLLRAIPVMLAGKDPGRAFTDLLDDLQAPSEGVERETLVTMTVACHAAVRAGKTMAIEEMRELLKQLEACELPRTCPHGRPTMIHLSTEALEREFRRR